MNSGKRSTCFRIMYSFLTFLIGLALLIPALYLMHALRMVVLVTIGLTLYVLWWLFKPPTHHYRNHDES